MRSRFVCLLVLFLQFHSSCIAQVEGNDFKTNFVFSVHSIDDFFDRFDYKPNTAFEKYVTRNYPGISLSREKLVYSLFNKKNKFFYQNKNVPEFVQQVTDSCSPSFIKYSDKYWYAELKCKVSIHSVIHSLVLVLKVEQPASGMFQWSVVSAKGDFLKETAVKINPLRPQVQSEASSSLNSRKHFLSPISHGIDFINLDNFFSSGSRATDYLYAGQPATELKNLVSLIQGGKIKFEQVDKITYHLLQISGWVVSVNYLNYNAKNSGWLIDNLMKVTPEQKILFLKNRLNVVI